MKLSAVPVDSACSQFLYAIDSPEKDVQIRLAALEAISPNELNELALALDSAERSRAAQFHFEADRRRFTATRGILRCLLGEILSVPASAVEFSHREHGKPEIAKASDNHRLRFNLSHAAGFAIFAFAWDRHLGIDLESAARLTNPSDDLAPRILSPQELASWRALPDVETRRRALLRAWTRKEAYAKATGKGLSQCMSHVEAAFDDRQTSAAGVNPSRTSLNGDWIFYDLDAPSDFFAALVVEKIGTQSQSRDRA